MSAERVDQLLSLIVQGDAGEPQWADWQRHAEADPTLWRRLALAQRDQAELCGAVNTLIALADDVPLPQPAAEGVLARIGIGAMRWSGWAVAAVLALVALPIGRAPAPAPPAVDGALSTATPARSLEDVWDQYIDQGRREGRVLGELPARILLDSRRVSDGYQLLYLRPVLETRQVPEIYSPNGEDERGEPVFVKWH